MSAILVAILDFFQKFYFGKTAADFLEISRKHVFTASNRNIIKNRVEKKKLEEMSKSFSFFIQNLIYIIICA